MRGQSGTLSWGIRWETIGGSPDSPVFGMVLPPVYRTRSLAARALRRLSHDHPYQPNPFGKGESVRVRYVVFARGVTGE